MLSKISNLFKKENPQAPAKFDHSKLTDQDPKQCPFMSKKSTEGQCPYKQQKQQKKSNKNPQQSDSEEQQKPRGGCPFMGTSQKKRNPDLVIDYHAYDQPFVSRYKYFLSAGKIDLNFLKKGKAGRNINRTVFNSYPIYLQHTLLFNGEDFKKVRQLEICSRFMAYEQLRQKGNKYYNKGKYLKALDYYERAYSLFIWLDYVEKKQEDQDQHSMREQSIKSLQNIPSERSFDMHSQSDHSKILLNLNSETGQSKKQFDQKNKQLDDLREKYKEFFVVYTDDNIVLHDGSQLEQQPDIDMHKSLLVQIYLNMAATYIKLNNFSLAKKVCDDALELTGKVSQVYLRKAQSIILNKSSTLQEAQEALKLVNKAIEMKPHEKIYANTNQNILKMLNLHNVDQAYMNCQQKCNQVIKQKQQNRNFLMKKVFDRAKQIHEVEQMIITEGKTPQQNFQRQTLMATTQYKILARMKEKYVRVLEFYTEAKNEQQILLAKREMQQVLRIETETNQLFATKIQDQKDQIGGINTEKIQKRIKNVKTTYASDLYNQGKFNFHVLEWAVKEIVKQQRQVEQQKQAKLKAQKYRQQCTTNGSNGSVGLEKKGFSYGNIGMLAILVPLIFILINYFVL